MIQKQYLETVNYLSECGYSVIEIFHQSRPSDVYYWVVASPKSEFKYNQRSRPTDEITISGILLNPYMDGLNPLTDVNSNLVGKLDPYIETLATSSKIYSNDYSFLIHERYFPK